ncbi:MAG: SDR family NAD(P)-dependent oxidoreductase [Chloroflexota bacterium]|nr:SDR family NAD(P)-dependent oxidoreductase [Chloroflexota bacterium]
MSAELSEKQLAGRVAVVTGASRGVGRRIAVRLGKQGAAVALIARSADALNETAAEIAAHGGKTLVLPADLSQPDYAVVTDLKARIESALGVPTILINAAGVFGPIALLKDADPAGWLETIAINTLSPFLFCRAFVGGMIAAKWGRIVNVTSAAALHPPGPTNSAYGTSKVALNQMTRHLAAELDGTGVTANVIHPGDVKTEMWADIREKVKAMGAEADGYHQWVRWVEQTGGDDPEKSADLVLNLMRDSAKDVSGQFLWIEGGLQDPIPSWGEPTSKQPWRE